MLTPTKTLRRAVENGGVVDVHNQPGTDIWYGGIRLASSREETPLIRFWDFSSNKEIKTIGIDTKRRTASNEQLLGFALSWNAKYALVASGANRDSDSDPIRITVWDLESGKIRRSWDDPTPR
jgi:WD40 repeat protein